ncbi:BrnT family toxin [Phyllobacterium sp. YR531]|uniref:BrnT family toxin n=1 Tax=Phyllobacterium sp. YR531 TaxID=1144343 RepID=UPI00026F63D4|nr:BrnT family toxin [Phyllobacterium sp. YR531]EJN03872.1 hypothetical protein PMI41_01507 [Phyllobacterium sp. YR531]
MIIIWDEPKRIANIEKHGLDFLALDIGFFLGAVIRPAKRQRLQAIGHLHNGMISVIFFKLGSEGWSIISMRPANPKERALVL